MLVESFDRPIVVGDLVRIGVYVLNKWCPMEMGRVVEMSADGTLMAVDTMSLHGGRPWIHWECVGHLRLLIEGEANV